MRPSFVALLLLLAVASPIAAQTPAIPAAPVSKAPPASLGGALGAGGLGAPLRPLNGLGTLQGLPPTGDPGPQCRNSCSQARYICGADDSDCGERWRQCVAACRDPARQSGISTRVD